MNKVMAGIDLPGNNLVIGIVDSAGQRLGHRRLDCELKGVLEFLAPYRGRLEKVAVESTYNWYWLVDGLCAAQYSVAPANPAKIEQYSGLKHSDDTSDAYFLAELLRLGILPTGYIYDAQMRPAPAILLDEHDAALATGEASINFEARFAEFFPFGAVADERALLTRAARLQITNSDRYDISNIQRCAAFKIGRPNPHYEVTIACDPIT